MARGPQRRNKMTGKSTLLTEEIARIMKTTNIVETASTNPRIRKRRGIFVALMTQRSGARSIAPQDISRRV
jgi:hypothetical protein